MLTKDHIVQILQTLLRLEAERHHPGYLRNSGVDLALFQDDVNNATKWLHEARDQ